MAVQGRCTFGTRMPINVQLVTEGIAREVKHHRTFKTYRPNFACQPLTTKFYARHDDYEKESHELAMQIEHYNHHLKQTKVRGPLCKYMSTITENQLYGWYFNTRLEVIDRNDPRFFRPLREDPQTKLQSDILADQARRKEPK